MCGIGEKECAICVFSGGCLAEDRFPQYRQLMIDTLKMLFNHDYSGYEKLSPPPKQEMCCINYSYKKGVIQ